MANTKPPTGDPNQPDYIGHAKDILDTIEHKSDGGMATVEGLGLDLDEEHLEDDLEAASSGEQLDNAEEIGGGEILNHSQCDAAGQQHAIVKEVFMR